MSTSTTAKETFWGVYWRMLRKTGWYLWVFFIVIVASQALRQAIPFASREFIDALALRNEQKVLSFLLVLIGVKFASTISSRVLVMIDRVIVPTTYARIDVYALERVLEKAYSFFTNTPSGQTLTKIRNLAFSFERLFGEFEETLSFVVAVTVALIALSMKGFGPLAVSLGYLLLTGMYGWRAAKQLRPYEKAKTEARSSMVGTQSDILTQAHTVLLFQAQKRERKEFETRTKAFIDAWMARASQFQRTIGVLYILAAGFEVFVLWVLYTGWKQGVVSVGDVVLYQSLVGNMIGQSVAFTRRVTSIRESIVQAEEAMNVLDTPIDVQDIPRAKPLRIKHGEITLDAAAFGYGQQGEAIKQLTLSIAAGERLAIVGRSGAGKSTLVKLLLRLYNLESGEIRIDGQPIQNVTQASLREAISYVPQEPLLFHRTIRENIAYGNPRASERQIVAAAKRAHCHDFISRLPEKYDSLVGERGVKLSGGERQRIAIARAILKNAPILILDEATSALDPESEQFIQKAMEELMKGKTVIAIAHRLSTIRHMDRVIVLDQGKVVDEGTHDELLARATIYRDFWERQTEGYRG